MARTTNSRRMPEAERLRLLRDQTEDSGGRGQASQDAFGWLWDLDLVALEAKLVGLVD